jgi:hypothetical protein
LGKLIRHVPEHLSIWIFVHLVFNRVMDTALLRFSLQK